MTTMRHPVPGVDFIYRPVYYRRKSDGFRVHCADWTDGTVSWCLDPMPMIAARAAGTIKTAVFERLFEPTGERFQMQTLNRGGA
jgi:hypothetical protein